MMIKPFIMTVTSVCLALFSTSAVKAQKPHLKKIQIIAHRGASFHAPENTVASAKLGWEQKADAVEIDIHLSADKKIMVIHDTGTKRTTGKDYKIASTISDTLRMLDAGNWKASEYKGEKVPFLTEILELVPKKQKLVIEIKSNKELVPILKEQIEKSGKKKQCIIISFDFDALVDAKKAMPEIPAYYLSSTVTPQTFDDLLPRLHENKIDGLNLNYSIINQEVADLCKKNNFPLLAWTVDDPEIAKKLIAMGVTAITTNKPKEMREALK
jgi:glycerophosphoryl diester phosphodiesterase